MTLPLNRIQLLQRRAWKGVFKQEHDNNRDLALISAYLNGNEEAGMQLVESYLDVFSYILRNPTKPPHRGRMVKGKLNLNYQDYEDMFQELLYQFFKLIEEFDPSYGKPFEHFIRATLHQRFYNRYFADLLEDKSKVIGSPFDEALSNSYEQNILLEEENNTSTKHIRLYQAFNKLTKVQRQILTLSVLKGYSHREIANELGCSVNFVKVNKHRALEKLRNLLGGE